MSESPCVIDRGTSAHFCVSDQYLIVKITKPKNLNEFAGFHFKDSKSLLIYCFSLILMTSGLNFQLFCNFSAHSRFFVYKFSARYSTDFCRVNQ